MSDVLFLSFYSKSGTVTLKMQTTTSRHSTSLSKQKNRTLECGFFCLNLRFYFADFAMKFYGLDSKTFFIRPAIPWPDIPERSLWHY